MLSRTETRSAPPPPSGSRRPAICSSLSLAAVCALLVAGCNPGTREPPAPPAETASAADPLIWPSFTPLVAPAPADYMRFGDFVDVDGDLAILGAPTGGKIAGQ